MIKGRRIGCSKIFTQYMQTCSLGLFNLKAPSRHTLVFVLNVIVNNGYFNLIYQNDNDNSRIKVLRNIREHVNIIIDHHSWNFK